MRTVLISSKTYSESQIEYLEAHDCRVILGQREGREEILSDLMKYQPDGIIVSEAKLDAGVFEAKNPNLKVLARRGAGYDGIDVRAARKNGVECTYAPIGNSASVAEVTMFHLLHAALNVSYVRSLMYEGFYKAKQCKAYETLCTYTLGIIGCGNIGSRVAERAMAMKMNVKAYDPYKKAADFPDGVEVVRDLSELLRTSDFVSIHTPVTDITKGFFNMEMFRQMKPTAYLINAARGALVVEEDAIKAVKEGIIAGCEFDTCANEPLDPQREILHTPGIYVTPHMGGSTRMATERVGIMDVIGIVEVLDGKKPSWPIPDIDYSSLPTYTDVRDDYYHAPDKYDIEAL